MVCPDAPDGTKVKKRDRYLYQVFKAGSTSVGVGNWQPPMPPTVEEARKLPNYVEIYKSDDRYEGYSESSFLLT